MGAAIAAGFAIGIWKAFEEIKEINQKGRKFFKPEISEAESAKMYKKWSRDVEMCRGWLDVEASGNTS